MQNHVVVDYEYIARLPPMFNQCYRVGALKEKMSRRSAALIWVAHAILVKPHKSALLPQYSGMERLPAISESERRALKFAFLFFAQRKVANRR
jgi:hypothetical protein